jgi:hypothetical protein
MSIQFQDKPSYSVVKLDGKIVGHVQSRMEGGWFYAPKGSSKELHGPVMATRNAVKESLK